MKKQFKLSNYAVTFSTRNRADEISNMLNEFVKTLHNDDMLVIDFTGVEAISYSFLDQFLSKVSNYPLIKDKRISISGFSAQLMPVLDKSLQRRSCSNLLSKDNNEQLLACESN